MLTKYLKRVILREESPMADQIASVDVYDMACGLDKLLESIKSGREISPEEILNLAAVSKILKSESEGW